MSGIVVDQGPIEDGGEFVVKLDETKLIRLYVDGICDQATVYLTTTEATKLAQALTDAVVGLNG